MTLEIEVSGRIRSVTVEPGVTSGTFSVQIGERAYQVGAVRTAGDGLLVRALKTGPATAGKPTAIAADKAIERGVSQIGIAGELEPPPARVREVFVTPLSSHVLVNLGGRTIAVTVNGRRSGRGAGPARQTQGEARVVAPMPGRVLRVLVSPGDHVAVRQPLVVVEAMKMENELRAPRAGRVRDVSATAGASVEAGRVLLVID